MRTKEFKDTYDGAPYDVYEIAEGAATVEDNPRLAKAGLALVAAHEDFLSALEEVGVEVA